MKKRKLKEIKRLAMDLEPLMQKCNQVQYYKGSELIEKMGEEKLANGTEVEADKLYVSSTEALHTINHARRLKKQFQKHGMAGAIGYRRAVNAFVEANKTQPDGKIN
ncbi:hypothetical protein UFOVP579_26 [uncultured Caudovirales phage]|uniref:Uncharacterized protein n=1 Tax=uncultured Caudovirales phage TaxID=2100421 RepID=A0A6J5LQU7_9CAUD|nr:hypothetical protein UFOVP302_26 [uncultured Caudovirales phage]CAB4168698.1 hypothetical protein UFOVP579_26 [uncultured Caudovirales phage]